MAVKNLNKLNSLNLFGFVKRLPNGFLIQRKMASCQPLMKPWPVIENEPDYTKAIGKNSPTSLVSGEYNQWKNRNNDRRFENFMAAEQVRKCNEILKDHFFRKRRMQQILICGEAETEPALSKKLRNFMADDVANKVVACKAQVMDSKRFLDNERSHNFVDYKPQVCGYQNRWHMKIPLRHLNNNVAKNTEEQHYQTSEGKRQRKPNKDLRPPGFFKSNESEVQKAKAIVQDTAKLRKMWEIGNRRIPRLE